MEIGPSLSRQAKEHTFSQQEGEQQSWWSDNLHLELVSKSPPGIFSLIDHVVLALPLRLPLGPPHRNDDLSIGPPHRNDDLSIRDVRWAPKLWAQDEKGWGERKATTPGPLPTSFNQSIGPDDVVH